MARSAIALLSGSDRMSNTTFGAIRQSACPMRSAAASDSAGSITEIAHYELHTFASQAVGGGRGRLDNR